MECDLNSDVGPAGVVDRVGAQLGQHELRVVEGIVRHAAALSDAGEHHSAYGKHVRVGGDREFGDQPQLVIGHLMNRTPQLKLKLLDTPEREQIARAAVTALAIKAGLPTLSADRAAAAIAAAVGRAPSSEVQLWAALDDGFVVLTLSGDGEHWCDQILARLDGWDATAVGEKVVVRLARTPLRAV